MTPNLHPALVHFPIALLTLYAIFECARFKKLQQTAYWFYVKACLVIVGSMSSVATYISGDVIEELFDGNAKIEHLIDVHSNFALATMITFAVLALSYLVQWIARDGMKKWPSLETNKIFQMKAKVSAFILKGPIVVPLALLGLALVTITGALGGSIVYGPDLDPAVRFIYDLFIGN